jgi:ribosome-associated protein
LNVKNSTGRRATAIDANQLSKLCARAADEAKAEEITVLDLRGISSFADYFVLCTGSSSPHLRAIAERIEERLRVGHRRHARSMDGTPESGWMIVDYSEVLIHVFAREKRAYYSLEDLWSDAARVPLD